MMTDAQQRRAIAQSKAAKKKQRKANHQQAERSYTVGITGTLYADDQRKTCARYCYINIWQSAGAGHPLRGVLRLYTCDNSRSQIEHLTPGSLVVIQGLSLKKSGRKQLMQTTPETIITTIKAGE